jgi:hypothetical protein
MPYPLIPAALVACFLLMWALIGGMIFRDSQLAVENEREADINVLPLAPHSSTRRRPTNARRRRGARPVTARVAS